MSQTTPTSASAMTIQDLASMIEACASTQDKVAVFNQHCDQFGCSISNARANTARQLIMDGGEPVLDVLQTMVSREDAARQMWIDTALQPWCDRHGLTQQQALSVLFDDSAFNPVTRKDDLVTAQTVFSWGGQVPDFHMHMRQQSESHPTTPTPTTTAAPQDFELADVVRWNVMSGTVPKAEGEPQYNIKVQVNPHNGQVCVDVDPKQPILSDGRDAPQISVSIEINEGLPCVHIGTEAGHIQSVFANPAGGAILRRGDSPCAKDLQYEEAGFSPDFSRVRDLFDGDADALPKLSPLKIEQNRLLREGTGSEIYEFALRTHAYADIPALQARLQAVGTGANLYCFSEIPGADIAALQARLLTVGLGRDLVGFARHARGADILALQARVLQIGLGADAYYFARDVRGADIAACQARVLAVGTGENAYFFAKEIPGADIEALQALVFKTGSCDHAFLFARDVRGADIPALQAHVLAKGGAKIAYLFAKHVRGADVEALHALSTSQQQRGLTRNERAGFDALLAEYRAQRQQQAVGHQADVDVDEEGAGAAPDAPAG